MAWPRNGDDDDDMTYCMIVEYDDDAALQVFTQPGLTERATHSVKVVN